MFHVANRFPAESTEFKDVFEVAAKTFPESEIANINVAVTELNNNNVDAALDRLDKMKENRESWNLLGVIHAKKGNLEEAAKYFHKSMEAGNKEASHNMQQLERYILDN